MNFCFCIHLCCIFYPPLRVLRHLALGSTDCSSFFFFLKTPNQGLTPNLRGTLFSCVCADLCEVMDQCPAVHLPLVEAGCYHKHSVGSGCCHLLRELDRGSGG